MDLLVNGDFNARYAEGELFPDWLVYLLVRDIDLIIVSDSTLPLSVQHGRRTNVFIDVGKYPQTLGEELRDPYEIERVKEDLNWAVPIKM